MGASLLAKALDQSAKMLNVPPSSRASSLPQGICGTTKSMVNTEHCGSELARESVGSVGKDVECAAAFASKLAPTEICGATKSMVNTEHCGSELARESVGSVGKDVECAAAFASKLAPTEICGATKSMVNTEHCGSEPARESGGSVGKDAGCASAFASRLAPTGDLWRDQINGQHGTLWERACSRKRWISWQRCWMCLRLREQARSH